MTMKEIPMIAPVPKPNRSKPMCSSWLKPKQKAARITEQMAYLRKGEAPEGDLPSLSEPFAIVDEHGNPISAGTDDEDLTHG
jgi:hypothetical protein